MSDSKTIKVRRQARYRDGNSPNRNPSPRKPHTVQSQCQATGQADTNGGVRPIKPANNQCEDDAIHAADSDGKIAPNPISLKPDRRCFFSGYKPNPYPQHSVQNEHDGSHAPPRKRSTLQNQPCHRKLAQAHKSKEDQDEPTKLTALRAVLSQSSTSVLGEPKQTDNANVPNRFSQVFHTLLPLKK